MVSKIPGGEGVGVGFSEMLVVLWARPSSPKNKKIWPLSGVLNGREEFVCR